MTRDDQHRVRVQDSAEPSRFGWARLRDVQWDDGTPDAPAPENATLFIVASWFGVSVSDIKGPVRTGRVAEARHIAMYFLNRDLRMSTPEVGRILGRHHTSVMHGVKRVHRQVMTNTDFERQIVAIRARLANSSAR